MTRQPSTKDRQWYEKISRTGYFFAAVLLHLVVFILVATWVVFPAFHAPPEFITKSFIVPHNPEPPPAPPINPVPVASIKPNVPAPTPTPIITPNSEVKIDVPIPNPTSDLNLIVKHDMAPAKIEVTSKGISTERLHKIRVFVDKYRPADNPLTPDGDPRDLKTTFPVYVASYANGDWGCNVEMKDGKIDAGSLPNLVAKINQWSHGNIVGNVVPTPLDISGPELLDKSPPFIFFTGHKDFVLTDAEVKNLQTYVEEGGAIWGDNALAGRGSRFDVAFRREMKRVVPDKDKNFEPFDSSDELFTKWFPLEKLPAGMNFYNEPVEHLDIDGKVAIIYTPNDYSDMFSMRILSDDAQIQGSQPDTSSSSPLYTSGTFLYNRDIFFRNFELPSCLAAQQLGMNIVGYLLVRFDPDLLLSTP